MKLYPMIGCLLCLSLLTACNPNNKARVNIVYDQVANFTEYKLSSDAFSTTSTNGMFVQYSIKQISNNGSEAKTFVFDKNRIVAITPDSTSNAEPGADNILLGSKFAHNVTVAAGQTLNNVGCIIKNVLTSNPQSLVSTTGFVDIIHQLENDQPVSMKRAANDSSVALVTTALPSVLQNLCN